VVLLYDEFHTVEDKKREHEYVLSDFLGAINEAQKSQQRYIAVLCGLPNVVLNAKKARSYSERMFAHIEVGYLREREPHDAITKGLQGSGHSFSDRLTDALVTDTSGYPYFIQYYGRGVITSAPRKANIDLDDYSPLKPTITKELDASFFDPRFDLASGEERDVLCAMSSLGGIDIPFKAITRSTGKNKKSVSRVLSRLENKGLAYNYKRGIYRFSIPMFRDYLKRKCSL
jgi:hypothetical protein